LRREPGLTAREIAKELNVDRTSVNSHLYKNLGVEFRRSSDKVPRWSFLAETQDRDDVISRAIRLYSDNKRLKISLFGQDWSLTIRVHTASRNDPIVVSDFDGTRSVLVTVSSAVIHHQSVDETGLKILDDAVIAMAASAMAWAVFQREFLHAPESFDFGIALREIYLSIVADVHENE